MNHSALALCLVWIASAAGSVEPDGLRLSESSDGFAYRFAEIGTTEADWFQVRPDGSVCVDLSNRGAECDLRLRGETLLLLSVDRSAGRVAGRDRFRFRVELGVKP